MSEPQRRGAVWTEQRRDRSDEGRRRVEAPPHHARGAGAPEHGDRSDEAGRRREAPRRRAGSTA